MFPTLLREFRRADGPGDDRLAVNLLYLISAAPDLAAADRTVIRIATGRGFEEYTLLGSYDEHRAILFPPPGLPFVPTT